MLTGVNIDATKPGLERSGTDRYHPTPGHTRVRTHGTRRAYAPTPRTIRTPPPATTEHQQREETHDRHATTPHPHRTGTAANRHARFHPMISAESLPCLELAGALVFAYLDENGRLCVSVDLDSAEDRLRHGAEQTVPVQVRIGDTVIADSATGPSFRGGLTIDQRTLEEWAGRPLNHTDLTRLHRALEHSTVPEAIGDITFSFIEGTDEEDTEE